MTAPNPDPVQALNAAIVAFNAGRRAEARTLLIQLTRSAPTMENAWMWLAAASENEDEKTDALRRVLRLNPNNVKARTALRQITGEEPADVPPPTLDTASAVARPARSGIDPVSLLIIAGIIIAIGVIAFALLNNPRVQGMLNPTQTPTPRPTLTLTPTPRVTLTASITPGGPTETPYILPTLPPTWTDVPTLTEEASYTPAPSETPAPTVTVIFKPTVTLTISETPPPIPTLAPIPTLPPILQASATGTAQR